MNLKTRAAQILIIGLSSVATLSPISSAADILNLGSKPTVLTKANAPKRGMTMKRVLQKFGKPGKRRTVPGKVTTQNPRITIWTYGKTVVYFENKRVIHTVIHH